MRPAVPYAPTTCSKIKNKRCVCSARSAGPLLARQNCFWSSLEHVRALPAAGFDLHPRLTKKQGVYPRLTVALVKSNKLAAFYFVPWPLRLPFLTLINPFRYPGSFCCCFFRCHRCWRPIFALVLSSLPWNLLASAFALGTSHCCSCSACPHPLSAALEFAGVRFRLRDNSTNRDNSANRIPVPVRHALTLFLLPCDLHRFAARSSVDEVEIANDAINAATGLRTGDSIGSGSTASFIGVACAVAVAAATTARFTR